MNNLSRVRDYVVRYGEEEMAMLLPDTQATDALRIAERTRETIETTVIEYEKGKSCWN